jgi:hypothetical protein
MPPGSTRVTVILEGEGGSSRLTLRHENLPSPELSEGHQAASDTYLRLAIRATGGDPGPDPHSWPDRPDTAPAGGPDSLRLGDGYQGSCLT